jgi:transposase-like protein
MISESIRRRGISVGEVSYKGHRYPAEIIAHCVWLYHRFPLSFREVEELMLVRGVIVSYETIRQWCAKFGPEYACRLRRRQPRPGDKWHLDEVFLTINGRRQYLWQAVDQDGNVLDILVQAGATPRPPSGSSANSSRGSARLLGCWSPTSSAVTQWRIGR